MAGHTAIDTQTSDARQSTQTRTLKHVQTDRHTYTLAKTLCSLVSANKACTPQVHTTTPAHAVQHHDQLLPLGKELWASPLRHPLDSGTQHQGPPGSGETQTAAVAQHPAREVREEPGPGPRVPAHALAARPSQPRRQPGRTELRGITGSPQGPATCPWPPPPPLIPPFRDLPSPSWALLTFTNSEAQPCPAVRPWLSCHCSALPFPVKGADKRGECVN